MKTLSLWQPHALAIGIGLKPWETRGWSTDYRGPIGIHAAKRPWADVGPWHTAARQILQEHVAKHGPVAWDFGAVICTADLVDCVRTNTLRGRIPAAHEFWGDFTDGEDGKGRFAFKLENVKILAQPVFVRGMQGWFDVDLGAEERTAAPRGVQQLGLFGLFNQAPAMEPAAAPEVDGIGGLNAEPEQACADLAAGRGAEDSLRLTAEQEKACELSRQFARACEAAGFLYRGYGECCGSRVYAYSRPDAPTVYELPIAAWDRTPEGLQRNAAALEMA